MGILISSLCPNVGIRIVRVSFNLDYGVIENRLSSNVQDISHLRYFVKPNDLKNSTLQKVSSSMFYCFLWIFFILWIYFILFLR